MFELVQETRVTSNDGVVGYAARNRMPTNLR